MPVNYPPGGEADGGVAIAADGGTVSTGTVVFTTSPTVTFGIDGSTVTASVATNYLTTARASNDAVGLNTAATQVTWTVNSSGISLNAGGYLTTAALSNHSHGNPTLALTNLTGTTASNSAGLTLSLSAANPGAGGGIAAAAGTQTAETGTVVFSNSNNVVFGMSESSIITASANSMGVIGSGANGNGTFTSGTLSFKAGDGITLSTGAQVINIHAATNFLTTAALSNHSHGNPTLALTNLSGTTASASDGLTLSLSAAAPGGGATVSTYFNSPMKVMTSLGPPIANQYSVVYQPVEINVTGTRLDLFGSVTVNTAANTSSAAVLYSMTAVILTKDANTLRSLSSATTNATATWNSNNITGVTGGRVFSVPINVNATPGNYFFALQLSTRGTGHAGAGTTSLGNTISLWGVGLAEAGAITVAEFGAATASSSNWFPGMGLNTSTGNITQISLSNLTNVQTGFQRANVVFRIQA